MKQINCDDEDHCLLSDFEAVRETFKKVESLAASFYLQCYLSAFGMNLKDISVAILHLTERRHGGLIIIQRNDPLENKNLLRLLPYLHV